MQEKARIDAQTAQQRLALVEDRVRHCADILSDKTPDDANPLNWRDGVVCE